MVWYLGVKGVSRNGRLVGREEIWRCVVHYGVEDAVGAWWLKRYDIHSGISCITHGLTFVRILKYTFCGPSNIAISRERIFQ